MTLHRWLLASSVAILLVAPLVQADEPAPAAGKDPLVANMRALGAHFLVTGFKASWSPDGKQLVCGNVPSGSGLQIVTVESKKGTALSETGKDPAWSPVDGSSIAFVKGNDKEEEVWLIGTGGEKPHKVADGGTPAWSADGKTLYFHSRSSNKIMSLAMDEADAAPKEYCDMSLSWYAALSPDAKLVAYVTGGEFGIVTTTGEKKSRWPLPTAGGGLVGWSPDGKQVGFGGYGHDDKVGLWILNVETGRAVNVDPGPFTQPAWSKDGSKLAFDLRPANRPYEVWTIDTKRLEDLKPMDAPAGQ